MARDLLNERNPPIDFFKDTKRLANCGFENWTRKDWNTVVDKLCAALTELCGRPYVSNGINRAKYAGSDDGTTNGITSFRFRCGHYGKAKSSAVSKNNRESHVCGCLADGRIVVGTAEIIFGKCHSELCLEMSAAELESYGRLCKQERVTRKTTSEDRETCMPQRKRQIFVNFAAYETSRRRNL